MANPWYADQFACPDCGSDLTLSTGPISCTACGYRRERGQPLDLRPINPSLARLELPRLSSVSRESEPALFEQVELGRPPLTYDGPLPERRCRDLLSAVQPHLTAGCRVLDLGCGACNQALAFGHLGCTHVGVDCAAGSAADLLADAHALPFRNGTFDMVFASAVLEHLHSPFLAFHEVRRVLRPGGIFCGTVSQGDPVSLSFFNYSAWALWHLAETNGMRVLRLWPSQDTLKALAVGGRYPRLIRLALRGLEVLHRRLPLLAPRKLFGRSKRDRLIDDLYCAASLGFVIRKC